MPDKIGLSPQEMIDFTPESAEALAHSIATQGYFYRQRTMTREEFAAEHPEITEARDE